MTQEEKQLLLIDLCARLPYGVKCEVHNIKYYKTRTLLPEDCGVFQRDNCDIKPYLRPMSSMTKEETEEFLEVVKIELKALEGERGPNVANAAPAAFEIDFYNAHHFDYRGLIEKGLALEAKEGMYKTEGL